jgi:hypothetical protein
LLRIPTSSNKDEEGIVIEKFEIKELPYGIKQPSTIINTHSDMRDLYNRKARLEYWINRINKDFYGNNRTDVLKFIETIPEKEEYFNYYKIYYCNTPNKKTI